jgi:peptidoglycan/xylan/chitin deacetylase (PgdA/CDA1 family)
VDNDKMPPLRRPAISRRVLLAAGGLVLLGGYAVSEGSGAPPAPTRPLDAPAAGGGRFGVRATTTLRHPIPARHTVPLQHPVQRDTAGAAVQDSRRTPHRGVAPATSGRPMYYIEDGRRAIALTIDDGPSPVYTPQILRLLHAYGVTATFSMIGMNVAAQPSLAREVADAGHTIVNHTWTHANLAMLAPAAVRDQMNRANDVIRNATGRHPGMFRAPYGAWSPVVLKQCTQMRLTPLAWSVDPRDWARPGVTSIVTNIMGNTRPGSIILEHDGGGDRSETVAALEIVLPRLLAAGFRFRAL